MAKSRMYRKKARKSARKSKRNTRRIKRRGGADLTEDINSRHAAYAMSPDRLGPK